MSFVNIVTTAGNIQGTIGTIGNFVNSIASFFAGDVVGVFDQESYDQLFVSARPMKASFVPTLKIMDHPIESGSLRSDFAISMPLEIELSMLLTGDEYRDTFQTIKSYYDTRTVMLVQLKTATAMNMLIQAMPFEENPEMFDVTPLSLKLREIQVFEVQYQALGAKDVATTTDQSTVSRGAQQPQSSILYNIGTYLKGVF